MYGMVTTSLRLIINKPSLPGRKVAISRPTTFSSVQAHTRVTISRPTTFSSVQFNTARFRFFQNGPPM